jgi:hypothetical protein
VIYIHAPLIGKQAYSRVIADSDEELHEFGDLLGLQPEWILTLPRLHFRVSGTKLQLALSHEGLQYLTLAQFRGYFNE